MRCGQPTTLVGLTILLKVNYTMALKKNFEEVTPAMTTQVEGDEVAVSTADVLAANDTVVEKAAQAAAPAPAGATAPAVRAASTSLAARNEAAEMAKAFEKQIMEMRGGDFSYGTYRVFKGNNGEIAEMSGDKASLGRWAKVHLLNWDEHFEVSPGSDDKSSKDFVGYSKDGVTLDSCIGEEQREQWAGKPVAAYLEYLKNVEDFTKADCRQFIDMACALLGTDSGDGPIGTVIQVTLSSSSIPSFKKYTQSLKDTARCVSMGLPGFVMPENPMQFFLIREAASKGNNRWTKLNFASVLPAKI